MNPQVENAIRSVARQCRTEIIAATKDKPRSEHEPIITALLDKHAKLIQFLPPNTFRAKAWLGYYIRQIAKEKS